MLEMTFRQQLWLTIIDKAILATVLAGVGYVANRMLESRKARQALRAKMAELQMPKIAEEIERYSRESLRIETFLKKGWREAHVLISLRKEDEARFESAVSDEERQRIATSLAYLPPTLTDAFNRALSEKLESSSRELERSWTQMRAQQFWLGLDLADILNRRYAELWYRMNSGTLAVEWLKTLPSSNPFAINPKLGWLARMRARLARWRDERTLERLGFSTSSVRADVGRIIDHISE